MNVLCVPDWHCREVDFRSVTGYVDNIPLVAEELIRIIHDEHIDIVVQLGDMFDGGYKQVHMYQSHSNIVERVADAVHGNFYLNIGNHYFHSKKSNPEVILSQPCGIPNLEYTPGKKFIPPAKPLVRVVDNLLIEGVQLAFHHHSETDKEYTTERMVGANMVIGFYHDECTIPNGVLSHLNMVNGSPDSYLSRIYDGIRIAIHGHIHIPLGLTMYNQTAVIVPGAIAPTQNASGYVVPSIDLPILTLSEGKCTYKTAKLNTHIENLTFVDCSEHDILKETNAIRKIARENIGVHKFCTIGEYIDQKGYNPYYKELIALGMREELSFPKVYDIINRESAQVVEV